MNQNDYFVAKGAFLADAVKQHKHAQVAEIFKPKLPKNKNVLYKDAAMPIMENVKPPMPKNMDLEFKIPEGDW